MKNNTDEPKPPLTVGIFGLGAIGREVALRLDRGIAGLTLGAAAARDHEKATQFLSTLQHQQHPVPILSAKDMAATCDIILECAPAAVFEQVALATLEQGKVFMPLSVGGLLKHPGLQELAERTGGRIIVPTGAVLGLDAVRAAAEGEIYSVRIITRKPPGGLKGAPHLIKHGIDVGNLTHAIKVFDGSARDGVAGFPANVNVAAALSLAGIGPDKTQLEIWADPAVDRNMHRIEVDADSARFTLSIESVPSKDNPKTAAITALSAVACLRGMVTSFRVGS